MTQAVSSASSVRKHMADASRRIGRLRRVDRAAVVVISLGGISVVIAVLGILVFVASEAIPLFRAASLTKMSSVQLASLSDSGSLHERAVGVDEHLKYLYAIEPPGVVSVRRIADGALQETIPIPGLGAATVSASSRSAASHDLAAGLSDGRVSLLQVQLVPRYSGAGLDEVTVGLQPHVVVTLDPAGRPIRQVAYLERDGQRYIAGLTGDGNEIHYVWNSGDGVDQHATLVVDSGPVTHVRIGTNGALLAGTAIGRVHHWELADQPRLTSISTIASEPITALEWMLGGNSFVVAAGDHTISGWLEVSVEDGRTSMMKARSFSPQGADVVAMALSVRERSFVTVDRAGSIVLRHQTSERVLATLPATSPVDAALISPKADALLVLRGASLERYALSNPHPEVSWKTLFGRVWYEGYARPDYVWQSTGATDDIEPKFSLVPLIFGTIKGTFYAMLVAVPLAVLAALFTSQFASPGMRARIKPTVEIMAALPSVVIGFLAGLYLAALVERHLVAVILMLPLMPLAGTSGVLVWRLIPRRIAATLVAGSELALILPLLLIGAWVAVAIAPTAEAGLFGGDARLWLQDTLGLTYDQRNCLVVGIAMGFAIIPIIFTISEDAFSSVPASLTAASLALGASRWQTAVNVVLPTASPGIFSAIMVGFGRAVGETMIVLMATGNTPVMDWSIFNGIRTMSANIAVEIPEAPHGGTLYRTLFLAAALLFAMTFIVNTVAEVIRQRLRERYKAA